MASPAAVAIRAALRLLVRFNDSVRVVALVRCVAVPREVAAVSTDVDSDVVGDTTDDVVGDMVGDTVDEVVPSGDATSASVVEVVTGSDAGTVVVVVVVVVPTVRPVSR